jgi:hypothetical protein
MTKIRDLATVIVNDLVAYFPIDTERYELYVKLEEHYKASANKPTILDVPEAAMGQSAYLAISIVSHSIQTAIEAYNRVFSVPFRNCSLQELRLTQRLLAATEEYAALTDQSTVERETLVGLHTLLWAVVLYKMWQELDR